MYTLGIEGGYINLGAGAELGIYYGGGPHWFVDKGLAQQMELCLVYKEKVSRALIVFYDVYRPPLLRSERISFSGKFKS